METLLIDEKSLPELHFDQGGEAIVYDQTRADVHLSRKVIISNNTKLTWYGAITGNADYSLQFVTESGESIIRMLLLATQNEKLKADIHSILTSSNTVTNIHILSLVGESGIIELNGTVQIDANIAKVK